MRKESPLIKDAKTVKVSVIPKGNNSNTKTASLEIYADDKRLGVKFLVL